MSTAENAKMYSTTTAATAPTQTASAAIKRENGYPKLSTLKPVRDLTLGGRGPVGGGALKKEFKPNLNVVRNKNANVKTSKDTTTRGRGGRGRGERGGGRGGGQRGGRGGATTLIQTSGLFSEGAGAVNIRKNAFGGSSSSSFSRSADDTPSSMRKPTVIKNELKKIDLNEEELRLRELLGDSDDERSTLMQNKTDLLNIPIKLQVKCKHIKKEPDDKAGILNGIDASVAYNDDAAIAMAHRLQALHVKEQDKRGALPRYPANMEEFLDLPQQQLFVMQFPDVLPTCEDGANGSDDGKSDKLDKSAANKTSTNADPKGKSVNATPASSKSSNSKKSLQLHQMEEGQIGKLVRYKSGKVKFMLGETQFNIEMGINAGMLQDLMSITTIREERQGNMINLGMIQAKLTVTPDWDSLFKHEQQQLSNMNASSKIVDLERA